MSSRSSRTIYVGNLPGDIRMREIEDLFMKVSFFFSFFFFSFLIYFYFYFSFSFTKFY